MLHPATLDLKGDRGRVGLESPDRGIAPGQFAAFYDGDVCLGVATIEA